VLLDLARAAAGAGRLDEALRLEQRLSETADVYAKDSVAELARLWTRVRLARLSTEELDEATAAALRRRTRQTGALREPPALFVALTWDHPDDRPTLFVRFPENPETNESAEGYWESTEVYGETHGIAASQIREREGGTYVFEVRREERDALRPIAAELLIVVAPGTADAQVVRTEVVLPRTRREVRFSLDGATLREVPPEG
jgi:hypothetical protein